MKEQQINTNESFLKKRTAVSVEEIIAAGGPTIFGLKSGKNNDTMIRALEANQDDDPFTDGELAEMLHQLEESK